MSARRKPAGTRWRHREGVCEIKGQLNDRIVPKETGGAPTRRSFQSLPLPFKSSLTPTCGSHLLECQFNFSLIEANEVKPH